MKSAQEIEKERIRKLIEEPDEYYEEDDDEEIDEEGPPKKISVNEKEKTNIRFQCMITQRHYDYINKISKQGRTASWMVRYLLDKEISKPTL